MQGRLYWLLRPSGCSCINSKRQPKAEPKRKPKMSNLKKSWMKSARVTLRVIGFVVMLTMLASCATNTPASSFCLIYKPTYFSHTDSEETILQVMQNNVAYEELCRKET